MAQALLYHRSHLFTCRSLRAGRSWCPGMRTASSHRSSMMEPYAKTAASLNLEVKGLTKTCRCSLLCLAKELPVRILEVGLNKRKHQVNACVPDNLTAGQGADRTLSANSSKGVPVPRVQGRCLGWKETPRAMLQVLFKL